MSYVFIQSSNTTMAHRLSDRLRHVRSVYGIPVPQQETVSAQHALVASLISPKRGYDELPVYHDLAAVLGLERCNAAVRIFTHDVATGDGDQAPVSCVDRLSPIQLR